jgi:hypothetical protein
MQINYYNILTKLNIYKNKLEIMKPRFFTTKL